MSTFDSITATSKPAKIIDDRTSNDLQTTQNNTQQDSVKDNISLRYWSAHRMKKFIVIWLDPNMDESDGHYQSSINQLRQIVNSIKVFNDVEQCVDFIMEIEDAKFFLIFSDGIDETIMPLIHDTPQLDSVYVFSTNHSKYEQWISKWKKIVNVFPDISSICDQLQRNIKNYEQDLIPTNLIPTTSTTDLNELDQTFMYLQILTEILLEMDYGKAVKKEFIECCRKQYEDNEVQLRRIDIFERDYELHSALWWYIKESFIVSMLARALQTQNVANIIRMGFYIKDLHQQIKERYATTNKNTTMITYRGQVMANSEFEKLTNNIGSLIAFSSFLSTTTSSVEALLYAERAKIDPQLTGTIFEMKIDPSISKIPFVSLRDIGDIPFCENEILFSMHTVFRIDAAEQVTENLWSVILTLTSDTDDQLQRIAERLRKEIEGPNPLYRLGKLLIKMSEFDKAEEIFKTLLATTSNVDLEQVVSFYNQLGYICKEKGNFSNALFYHEKALENQQKIVPPNHLALANIYNQIGEVHQLIGNYSTALSHYKSALIIDQDYSSGHLRELVNIYNNIGQVYNSMEDFSVALSYFQKTLEIQEKSLVSHQLDPSIKSNNINQSEPSNEEHSIVLSHAQRMPELQEPSVSYNYSDLATTYNNIGRVYYTTKEYSTALTYYQKALEIQQKSLPSEHPLLAITYNNVGQVFHAMKEYATALSNYQKAFDIQQKSLLSTHLDLAMTYTNMAESYIGLGDYLNGVAYYKKTSKIQEVSLSANHSSLAVTYNKIGHVHELRENYSDALFYYEKALKIQHKTLPDNHSTLAMTSSSIGRMHLSTGNFSDALTYHKSTLGMQTKSLPPNDPLLAETHYHIALVLRGMQQYGEAVKHALCALNIARYSFEKDQDQIQKYQEYLNEILLIPECNELAKTIDMTEWTYPFVFVLHSSHQSRLHSILSELTDGHLMSSILPHQCLSILKSNEQIKTIICEIFTDSIDERDCLLKEFSSFDQIESIYLLGKPPETSEERYTFFSSFCKVSIFCDDEEQLGLRWALDTANEFRKLGGHWAKVGKTDLAREYFGRGRQLYDRLDKFIDQTRQKKS